MSLTRKDFIELAFKLKELFKEIENLKTKAEIKDRILNNIISFCISQNENFDTFKFKALVDN